MSALCFYPIYVGEPSIYYLLFFFNAHCSALEILRLHSQYSLNITITRLICMISLCRMDANRFRAMTSSTICTTGFLTAIPSVQGSPGLYDMVAALCFAFRLSFRAWRRLRPSPPSSIAACLSGPKRLSVSAPASSDFLEEIGGVDRAEP